MAATPAQAAGVAHAHGKMKTLPCAVADDRKDSTVEAKTLADITAALEAERDRLAHEVSDLERDSAQMQSDTSGENNYRDHMGDQGTATFGKELDMTLEGNARDLYAEVLNALERVEAGTFGTCVGCGAQIAPERLLAMPAAALCITCKEREESH